MSLVSGTWPGVNRTEGEWSRAWKPHLKGMVTGELLPISRKWPTLAEEGQCPRSHSVRTQGKRRGSHT